MNYHVISPRKEEIVIILILNIKLIYLPGNPDLFNQNET